MAHLINNKINQLEKRQAVPCDNTCVYWKFPHLETACVLSDVYSVKKGELCFEHKKKAKNK